MQGQGAEVSIEWRIFHLNRWRIAARQWAVRRFRLGGNNAERNRLETHLFQFREGD